MDLEQALAALQAETEDRRRQVGELQFELEAAQRQREENWKAFERANEARGEADREYKALVEAATGSKWTPFEVALEAIRAHRAKAEAK
jgi:chromosome segregation ATPase